jgi:hypothetical protein
MTPNQIRNSWSTPQEEQEWMPMIQAQILQELCAQIAELNVHLKVIADTAYADGMARHGQ